MKGRFSALVSIDMCHENNVFIDFLDIQINKYIYIKSQPMLIQQRINKK